MSRNDSDKVVGTVNVQYGQIQEVLILLNHQRAEIKKAQESDDKVDLASMLVDGQLVLIEAFISMFSTQLQRAEEMRKAMTGVQAPSPADLANLRSIKGVQ